ncbi:hypothetical protein A1D22_05955 [Pasteurellaceae bacterium LFhippo2]|nr:hypothetical protein [Pasteurellaceae bacterium LFhippo2]
MHKSKQLIKPFCMFTLSTFAVVFCFVIMFKGCQEEPAVASYEQPELPVVQNFEQIKPLVYNPCEDPLLKYERGLEGRERQKACGLEVN